MASDSPALRAVIFDCDGVLVDTEPLHYKAFQDVLRPMGLGFDYDHYLESYIGFDDRDAFLEAFREASRPLEPDLLARLMLDKALALQRIASEGLTSFPGVVDLVRDLAARKAPLAVASGALRSEVVAFTAALGIADAFDVIVGADDVTRSKPDPETYVKAFQMLCEKLSLGRVDPGSCIAIEDTPAGIESARSAGLFVVGVSNSYPIDYIKGLADYAVEALTELDFARMEKLLAARKL